MKDDLIRIRHMLDAAHEALSFVKGRNRNDLLQDRMLTLSILKCLEIIGEAASKISSETIEKYPGIPWVDIIGMRNRLVHVYFDINVNIVWNTLTNDLSPLIKQLELIVKESEDNNQWE